VEKDPWWIVKGYAGCGVSHRAAGTRWKSAACWLFQVEQGANQGTQGACGALLPRLKNLVSSNKLNKNVLNLHKNMMIHELHVLEQCYFCRAQVSPLLRAHTSPGQS